MHELFITAPLVIWKKNLPADCNLGKNSPCLITPKTSVSEPPWTPQPRWTHHTIDVRWGCGDQGPFWRPGPLHAWSKVIWVSSKWVYCHFIYSLIHSFIHSTTGTYCTTMNKINKTSIRDLPSNTSSFYCGTVYRVTFLNRLYSWKLTSTKIFPPPAPGALTNTTPPPFLNYPHRFLVDLSRPHRFRSTGQLYVSSPQSFFGESIFSDTLHSANWFISLC